jgi:protein-S-isoprenylcysteine O-methyltransferase Ste14
MVKRAIEKLRMPASWVFVALLVALIVLSKSRWDSLSPLVGSLMFCLGVFLAGVGSLGRMWCSLYIGGRKTKSLVTMGPYSICRNPLYFFSLTGLMGVGFASETLLIPAVLAVAFAAYYPFVIKAEEAHLLAAHGEQFEQYRRVVPTFFPRLSLLKEPQEYVVNPILFRRHLFSALWFVWLIGLLELVETLHAEGVLPVLLRVY